MKLYVQLISFSINTHFLQSRGKYLLNDFTPSEVRVAASLRRGRRFNLWIFSKKHLSVIITHSTLVRPFDSDSHSWILFFFFIRNFSFISPHLLTHRYFGWKEISEILKCSKIAQMKNFSLFRTIEKISNDFFPRKFKIARAEKFIRCQRSTLVIEGTLYISFEWWGRVMKKENNKKIRFLDFFHDFFLSF